MKHRPQMLLVSWRWRLSRLRTIVVVVVQDNRCQANRGFSRSVAQVNKWWLYNTVTQMGGWETVKYNGWLPLLYEEMALTVTDAGNRLKRIYESDLFEFELHHFKGKRYNLSDVCRCSFVQVTWSFNRC